MRYGISTLFLGKPLIDQLSLLQELEVENLEFWPPRELFDWEDNAYCERFSKELKNYHLSLYTFHICDIKNISTERESDRKVDIGKIYRQLEVAKTLGFEMVVMHAGAGCTGNEARRKERLRISKESLEKKGFQGREVSREYFLWPYVSTKKEV